MDNDNNDIKITINGVQSIKADGDGMNNGDWYYLLSDLCKKLGANVILK